MLKSQANAAATALIAGATAPRTPRNPRTRSRSIPIIGLQLGMAVGTLVGSAACYVLTHRFMPGPIVGQGLGGALGVLIGLFLDRKKTRFVVLLLIIAGTLTTVGTLPLLLAHGH